MNRRTFLGTSFAAGLVSSVLFTKPFQTSANGQDMRIETEVYTGKSRQPVFENITLFTPTAVYDFSRTGPEKITVYQRKLGRFVLLNVAEKTKVTLDHETVDGYVELLKTRENLSDKEPFLFNPKFTESFDDSTKELILSSDQMTYRIKGTQSKSDDSMTAYVEFADWYSKLSATDPRQMPPFARLELNKAISRHGLIPKEVDRVYRPKNSAFGTAVEAKTKHYVVWQLSSKDRERIENATGYISDFRNVSLSEFYGLAEAVAAR